MLSIDDFPAFFREVYATQPFPWQSRLARQVAEGGSWPDVLDLPTGVGKTAAIDIAVFHLAIEASRRCGRRAPVRIAFIVDRRLIVDDAFERARRLAGALRDPVGPVTSLVAEQLRTLSGHGAPPLIACRLRGGVPREDDWARTASQPTIVCSTVDQAGSRLLFRGYGVSDSMKPVHAGLLGSDCLILLDEVHLAEPFRQTLGWVQIYKSQNWREAEHAAPWGVALLSATPAHNDQRRFQLDERDWEDPLLAKRLHASKPARLVAPIRSRNKAPEATADDEAIGDQVGPGDRAALIVEQTRAALDHFQKPENGVPTAAVCIVVNRVARARALFERVKVVFSREIETGELAEPVLMIGPARPLDRDNLVVLFDPIRTKAWKDGDLRTLDAPLILVATQCIEAGVDLDFDALITEAAPVDSLRQRFGRLNRSGRPISPYAAIIASGSELTARYDDPVYGTALKPAWDYLLVRPDGGTARAPIVDFGIAKFIERLRTSPVPVEALSCKDDAPVLLPAHLDLLSQTSPVPAADPDISLYLHGPKRQPVSISVIWRADLHPESTNDGDARRVLMLVPPRASEAIELPLWAVRRWLAEDWEPAADTLADVAASGPGAEERLNPRGVRRLVFRWTGDDDRSRWVGASELRPGDTIVAPSRYGGADEFGWNPRVATSVTDVGREASVPFAGRHFAVRIAPGLLGGSVSSETLAEAIAGAVSRHWRDMRAAVRVLDLSDAIQADLDALDKARSQEKIAVYVDVYGNDEQGRPRGVIFVAPSGIADASVNGQGALGSTEDDTAGSMPGFSVPLDVHNAHVANEAAVMADVSGFPAARVRDLGLAGRFHDIGKADPRFQAWLQYGDPLGPDPRHLLAKSGRRLPRVARTASGLPDRWRHEALSVRLASAQSEFAGADDAELVLWLVGTHHGHGRPLFPHCDPTEKAPHVGPQSLSFDYQGVDWPTLFERLKSRYGLWELARMEAVLRLADHRASENSAPRE